MPTVNCGEMKKWLERMPDEALILFSLRETGERLQIAECWPNKSRCQYNIDLEIDQDGGAHEG